MVHRIICVSEIMAGLGEFPFKRISIFMSTAECSNEESKENSARREKEWNEK